MRFSNPSYFELTDQEILDQQEQLAETRDRHYRELVESGAAQRIIDSPATTNLDNDRSSLTEGTLLYPFRHPQWNLSFAETQDIYEDAGVNNYIPRLHGLLPHILGDKTTENYVLYMGRHEPRQKGANYWVYAAGLVFDMPSSIALNQEPYISLSGIEVADLQLMERQLAELSALAIEKSLLIIDPLTLKQGPGQIVSYGNLDNPEAT